MTMRTAKVFANGRSLAVRIPREWLGGADEVILEQVEGEVRIRPQLKTLGEFAAEFRDDPVVLERLPQTITTPRSFDEF